MGEQDARFLTVSFQGIAATQSVASRRRPSGYERSGHVRRSRETKFARVNTTCIVDAKMSCVRRIRTAIVIFCSVKSVHFSCCAHILVLRLLTCCRRHYLSSAVPRSFRYYCGQRTSLLRHPVVPRGSCAACQVVVVVGTWRASRITRRHLCQDSPSEILTLPRLAELASESRVVAFSHQDSKSSDGDAEGWQAFTACQHPAHSCRCPRLCSRGGSRFGGWPSGEKHKPLLPGPFEMLRATSHWLDRCTHANLGRLHA